MSRLGGLPHAQVYLDAGNPGMFANPARLAGPLVRAGIRAGRGFAAGQYWAGYAEQLAQGMERRGG
jgi:hypothetical protein